MAALACNRVAIITGGAQGIGRGVTKFLLGHTAGTAAGSGPYAQHTAGTRWGVVVVDVDEEGMEDAKRFFHEYTAAAANESSSSSPQSAFSAPPRVAFVTGDCALEETAKQALQTAIDTFGRVDLLVNNAGGGLPKVALRGQSLEEFYEILHRNVGTAYVFSKVVGSFWEEMMERGRANVAATAIMNTDVEVVVPSSTASTAGSPTKSPSASPSSSPLRAIPASAPSPYASAPTPFGTCVRNAIVNISSTRALQSEHFSEPYAAGKGGVVSLTHALASSLSHIARVNAINLGWIDVSGPEFGPGREEYYKSREDIGQHWCNKVGEADDVAHAVLFLYENYFMSGQSITLDGGMTKRMHYVE